MKVAIAIVLWTTMLSSWGEPETVVYQQRSTGNLLLDIHVPSESSEDQFTTILWIHGGGWRQGSRENWKLIDWLPDAGYGVVCIDYRLTDTAIFPAQLEDCQAALDWIRENGKNYGLSSNRIVTAGLSAGAHLATLLAVSGPNGESEVSGVLHFFGPSDFVSMMKYARKPDDVLNTSQSPVYGLLGGPLAERAGLARTASPVTHLDKDDPPILIIVGSKDSLMTQRQCARLYDAASEAGVRAKFHTIEGVGHGGSRKFYDEERRALITQFLRSLTS